MSSSPQANPSLGNAEVYPNEIKILLVDDRAENLLVLEETLEKKGRIFYKAYSGNEALKLALKEDIGLILLDVQMPDMDGFEVARILKSNPNTSDISIVFVTAINKELNHVLRGFEEGAVDYLQKPLDIDVTRAKVAVFENLYFSKKQLKHSLSVIEKVNRQLERFAYTVSHDLKSPLAGITTLISALEYEKDDLTKEDLDERIQMIGGAARHLLSMIDSFLDYSIKSYDEHSKEDVNVSLLVKDIIRLLFCPPNIKIVIVGNMPILYTRRLKLQQVFQNLISNAVKYNNSKTGIIEVGFKDLGEMYEFFVRDNGQGISEADQQKLFKLFTRGTNRSTLESSTGIGLHTTKYIVEEQGGNIWVESILNEGSTFYFTWAK